MKPTDNSTRQKLAAQALMDEGNQLQFSRNFVGAINEYSRAIEVDDSNPMVYHQRGWAKLQNNDKQGAISDWTKAIELNPSFTDAYADRASARVSLDDINGALEDYEAAIKANPRKEKLFRPVIERISKDLTASKKNTNEVDAFIEKVTPMNEVGRAEFLRTIGGVALATTAALSFTGCNRVEGFNGKKGAKWGFIIDLERCVACKACVASCKNENKTPPGVAYNVFLEEEHGKYPHTSYTYFTRPCMHCASSSCSKVCPVSATYHREDGIVVVDYNKCIGCRYCIAACPYGARSFDYGHNYIADPDNPYNLIPSGEYNGKFGLRKSGTSPIGNVRKCTLCLHLQDENGVYKEPPACSRTCMGKAIHFGDMSDPEGKCIVHGENLHELLARRNHHRLKEELGNNPNVYYLT